MMNPSPSTPPVNRSRNPAWWRAAAIDDCFLIAAANLAGLLWINRSRAGWLIVSKSRRRPDTGSDGQIPKDKEADMPYASVKDLPASVHDHLPAHAQEIYRSAFNNAWVEYEDRGPARREQPAHRVAWAAVKRK